MPIISAIGRFCCNKFVETPDKKVFNMSKLGKPYFSTHNCALEIISKILLTIINQPKRWISRKKDYFNFLQFLGFGIITFKYIH